MTKISRWAERGAVRVARTEQPRFSEWSPSWLPRKIRARLFAEGAAFVAATAAVLYGTMLVKQSHQAPALAVVVDASRPAPELAPQLAHQLAPQIDADPVVEDVEIEFIPADPAPEVQSEVRPAEPSHAATSNLAPMNARWFNGRPVRVKGVLKMRVTAYSPDERSCGDSADGITATLHSVETNNFQLVAADPRVLKYGSLLTVPGYAGDHIVPVLDCGGKIKGNRLDLLYPTHEQARKWGSKVIAVTVWEYADGKPAPNPRKVR